MTIYQHCVKVIGRGLYCCPLPDLIALLCCVCNSGTHRRKKIRHTDWARAHFAEHRGRFHVKFLSPARRSFQSPIWHVCISVPKKCENGAYNGTWRSFKLHKSRRRAKRLLRCHDHRGDIKRSDRPSGIISAPGCCYLGRPENPPEHWAEYPPSGAHARKAWPCDTSAGGAASQIYLGNQSEPGASPNPAGESSAFPPVIAPRIITDGVNENTDIFFFFFCNT